MADVAEFFTTTLPKKLEENPTLAGDINGSYAFDIDGAGQWSVDLTDGAGKVSEGIMDGADCVVTVTAEDFGTLLDNPMMGPMLFTQGKLNVTNPALALSLTQLLD